MMHLLLAKLYNCRVEGRIIHEVYRNKQDWEPHFGMCDKYFTQLLTLARCLSSIEALGPRRLIPS